MSLHELDNALRLAPIRARPSPVVDAIRNVLEPNTAVVGRDCGRRWECHQPIAVELRIREGDEALVSAPIVPLEGAPLHGGSPTVVKDAFEGFQLLRVVALFLEGALKEACRGKLFRIAANDELLTSQDGPGGVLSW